MGWRMPWEQPRLGSLEGLAQNGTGGGVGNGFVFVPVLVKPGDPRKAGGRLGGLGEIFVAFEAHRDANLSFGDLGIGARRI